MNILSKTIVLIGVLLAICLFSFGIYMQDLWSSRWTISGLILHRIGSRNPTHFA